MQHQQSPRGALRKMCREIFGVTVFFGSFQLYYTSNIPINSLIWGLFNNYITHRGWWVSAFFVLLREGKLWGEWYLMKGCHVTFKKIKRFFLYYCEEIGISLIQNINGTHLYQWSQHLCDHFVLAIISVYGSCLKTGTNSIFIIFYLTQAIWFSCLKTWVAWKLLRDVIIERLPISMSVSF